MKQKNYQRWSRPLLLTLLSIFMAFSGASSAWADTQTEGFASGVALPEGWSISGGGTLGTTFSLTSDYNNTGSAGDYCLGRSSTSDPSPISYIITPKVTGNVTIYYRSWASGSGNKKIFVYKWNGTDTDGAPLGSDQGTTSTYQTLNINLGSTETQLAIRLQKTVIDDFTADYVVEGALPKPTAFTSTATTYNSATFSWTAGGEETAWQIAYDTDTDFDKDRVTPAPTDITAAELEEGKYTLTGLNESTTYYAYLRAKSGEDVSSWTSKISFITPETYPTPTDFAQTAFTATTASMSWTANGGESKWNIKYSTDENFDPASAGTLVAVTTNPYTLEGLTDGTTYYAYVQADYGSGHTSNWSNKITLTPTSTLNLLVNDGSTTNSYVPVYGWYADQGTHSQFIIPATSLSGMTNRQITKLTVHASTANASFTSGVFEVYLKNVDAETTTFADNTLDWTGMTKTYSGSLSVSSNTMVIEFSTPFIYTTGSLMIGFKETTTASTYPSVSWYGVETAGNTARYMYGTYNSTGAAQFLPKMTITSDELPAVMTPTGLVKNSVTATTATLGWTENGDATTWQIKYSTTESFDPDSEGTLVEANAKPYTVTGLEPETTYYAYVRAKKGGDVSDWSNKVSFTTEEMYPKPTAISVSPADVSATFRWTAGRDEAAWQIKYSTDENFDPASEGTLQAVTTNPYTLSGLTVGETYYAYIRADYGESHYSAWSNKLTLTTGVDHELTVNEGNGSTTNGSVPFYGSYADEAIRGSSQFIIPASQLGSMKGGSIDKITFYTTGDITWSSGVNPTFKVYLKEVNNEKFGSKEFIDWATMTEIYDGEIAFDGTQLNISLVTPFNYSGGNLMVGFYETVAGGWCATTWVGTSADNEVGVQNASGATTYNWAAFLPKTTFGYETLTGPRLAVSTDALDFGELNQSSTAEDKQETFTISNTGVAELTGLSVAVSGTGYSVSALPRTNITTAGAESTSIELTVTLAPTVSGSYPGTVTISAAGQPNKVINLTATYVADPILGVFNDVDATDAATTGETINFGYAEEAPVYTYYIKNTGAGTLDIAVTDGGLTVSPANASLAAGAQQAFTITPNVANADATVTFTGTNHDGGAEIGTFTVTLQGTVMPLTTTFFEGFNYATGDATPDATTTELDGWEINTDGVGKTIKFYQGKIYYYASSTETANVVTPKLRVSGTSDELRISAYTAYTYASSKLIISYSADKTNWVVAATKTGNSDFDGNTYTLKDFVISGIPEGSYYFKIEMCDVAVNHFYGFSTTLPDAIAVSESVDNDAITTGVLDVNVTYTKAAEKWGTIALPFETTATELGTVYGTTVNAYQMKSYDGSNLVFENTETLEAGKPYVIYAPDEMSGTKTFYNKNITATTAGSDEKGTGSTVTFQATYAPIAAPNMQGKYGVTPSGKVQIGGSSASLKALRGYLTTSAGAHLNIIIDDETTGIKTLLRADDFENGDIYNLKGQKVEKAHKGLYIVNGRKVVVK